jgi:type II secretory pathway predicted ATPase ExeA
MTTNLTTAQAQLLDVAKKIRDFQTGKGWSDSELMRKIPAIGSTRSFTRILSGEFDSENTTERWLMEYRAIVNVIDAMKAGDDNDELYDDLTPAALLRVAFVDAMNERGLTRLIIVEGQPGSGKTASRMMLCQKFGARVVGVEANSTWKDSPGAMLKGISDAIGIKLSSTSAYGKLDDVLKALRCQRIGLCIDEAHHLGPVTLNLVKTIINQSPGEVVLLAMSTLWQNLETKAAYLEAQQLTKNRLLERIKLDGVDSDDVEKMLVRRLKIGKADLKNAVRLVTASVEQCGGNLSFIRLVCRKAAEMAGNSPVDLDIINKAATKTAMMRGAIRHG